MGLGIGREIGEERLHVMIYGMSGMGGYAALWLFGLVGAQDGHCFGGYRLGGQGLSFLKQSWGTLHVWSTPQGKCIWHINRKRNVTQINQLTYRANSPNSGCLPNTGFWPLYTMLSHFAAFGRTKN